jgi:GTPase SAR1 family protein
MNKIAMSESEIQVIKKEISTTKTNTSYNFLKQHLGLKPGKLHLFIGVPGGGKSTLRNSLIIDFLRNNPGKIVCLHLSEESVEDFKVDLVKNPAMIKYLPMLRVTSEQDNPVSNSIEDFELFVDSIIKTNCGLFVFDNITTSDFYGETPKEQSSASKRIKQALRSLECPVSLFAHTDATVKASNRKMIDQNEIRGSKKIVNLSEFLYILQTFVQDGIIYTILRIVKHRAADADEKIFRLVFNKETRSYDNDIKIDPETYLTFFKSPQA